MITITNGKEKFTIKKNKLWERKEFFKGLATKFKYSYWGIELLFVKKGIGKFEKIIKCLPDGDDIDKEYINLDNKQRNYILLNDDDYAEVKMLYDNMNTDIDYRKEAYIESTSILFAYELYQNHILEDDTDVDPDDIFYNWINQNYCYKNYKEEIYAKAKKILKEKYNVENIL